MLLTKFIQYLKGYVIITVTGPYPERFFNVCARHRILLWNIFPCSKTMFKCSVSNAGFRLLPPIVKKTGVHISIIKKGGLPILFKKLKRRFLFLGGLGIFGLLLIFLNLFVWKIELTGCETISSSRVRQALAENGLTVGTFRPFLDEKHLQNQVLLKIPELAWLWVDKSGSKVTIEVKERVQKPAVFDENLFCNIQAQKDGVIESMVVKSGTPMVEPGDTVRKGDLLVSGLILSEKGVEPRKVQSEAEIYARVWYEKTKAYSLKSKTVHETGKVEKKTTLHFFDWHINLFFNEKPAFDTYIEETQEMELKLFGRQTGLGLSVRKFRESVTTEETMDAESMAQSGGREIEMMIDEETAANGQKQSSRMNFTVLDEDTIEVNVVSEYLEDIAQKVRIE